MTSSESGIVHTDGRTRHWLHSAETLIKSLC